MTDLYLYQTLHLLRGRVRLLDRHVALLDRCARELFGRRYTPDLRQLEQRVAAASEARCDTGVSSFVRLELSAAGEERLLPAGISYYEGYALRSVQPRGVTVHCDPPFNGWPTPVREASAAVARRMAELAGGQAGVLCGADGSYHTAEGAPLAAVHDRCVWLAPESARCEIAPAEGLLQYRAPGHRFDPVPSVEYGLLAEAVRAAGLTLQERAFGPAECGELDELFWLDHRGITAMSHIDGRPLMHLLAERVAAALEKRFAR